MSIPVDIWALVTGRDPDCRDEGAGVSRRRPAGGGAGGLWTPRGDWLASHRITLSSWTVLASGGPGPVWGRLPGGLDTIVSIAQYVKYYFDLIDRQP